MAKHYSDLYPDQRVRLNTSTYGGAKGKATVIDYDRDPIDAGESLAVLSMDCQLEHIPATRSEVSVLRNQSGPYPWELTHNKK